MNRKVKILYFSHSSQEMAENLDRLERNMYDFYYRGESKIYELKPTLERELYHFNDYEHRFKVERDTLRDFRSKLKIQTDHGVDPSVDDNLTILSLLRHYGGSTRFLDFTHSFSVALYFACLTPEQDGSVICINKKSILETASGKLPIQLKLDEEKWNHNEYLLKKANDYIDNPRSHPEIIFPVIPEFQNRRFLNQQGVFLFPGSLQKDFKTTLINQLSLEGDDKHIFEAYDDFTSCAKRLNYKGNYYEDIKDKFWDLNDFDVIRVFISQSYKSQLLHDLNKRNLNAVTLFPDLEGLAKSTKLNALFGRFYKFI